MSLHFARNFKLAAAWLFILAVGTVFGWFGYRSRRDQILADLIDDTKRSAVAFDPREMRRLAATAADLETPAYIAMKNRLRNLQVVNPQVRSVYVLRIGPEAGKVVYLADSAAPGTKPESLPGDNFGQAAGSIGLQETIRSGRPTTEGPLSDLIGQWVSGYAPIRQAASLGGDGAPREILGVDLNAEDWNRELWLAGLRRAFYVWMLLGLPLATRLVVRRQLQQRNVIRNLSEAMEQSHSALIIIDLQNRIEYANRGLCEQIGYSREELLGRSWRDFHVNDAVGGGLRKLVATLRAGRSWEGEWLNRHKNGGVYPVRGVVTPVKHEDGSLSCFVAVFDDVTDLKRREAELRDARDLAEAGNRAKSQFLATMSHEVRTPLNGIVGFTSLLLDTNLASDQREYVQTIRASGEVLIQLTTDILDFARIESGKLKLDPLACDPRECVEEALDLLAAKAAEKKIELLHRIEPGIPATIITDPGRLRQVLVNLIGNAVKFTESGEVAVSMALVPDSRRAMKDRGANAGEIDRAANGSTKGEDFLGATDLCTLEFKVRDTGIGIASDQHTRLFKPFSQVDDSTTRRYNGTGLGLAISRNLVRLMGGEIDFVSERGVGSTFTFTVQAPIGVRMGASRDLGGLRVGIAAQSGSLRAELADLVTGWNAELTEVKSPDELAEASWDVALVDISDSVEKALIAESNPSPGVPPANAFGLVPVSLPSHVRQALRTHFRLLINKPVRHEALFAVLSGANPRPMPPGTTWTNFGLRVLVVEDNRVNQRLVQRVLANLGCTLVVVDNGRRALEELAQRATEYDVVLLDLHMPEMDGITALRELRAGRAGLLAQTIWVIALTADVREEQRTQALAAGLNDYLTKPLKLAELEAALRRFQAQQVNAGA